MKNELFIATFEKRKQKSDIEKEVRFYKAGIRTNHCNNMGKCDFFYTYTDDIMKTARVDLSREFTQTSSVLLFFSNRLIKETRNSKVVNLRN